MSVLAKFVRQRSTDPWPQITLQSYVDNVLGFNGWAYKPQPQFTLGQEPQEIIQNFSGFVSGAYRSSGVVFACIQARALTFSEAVFKFQQQSQSRPGKLFGTQDLAPLETPWTTGTTGDLLARMSIDADLCGTAYVALGPPSKPGGPATLRRLRPDWVTVVGGSMRGEKSESPLWQWDVEPIGYLYHPGGRVTGAKPQILLPEQVAVFTPWGLDPEAALIGASPLAPIVEEILGDRSMTVHKRMFFENGATSNLLVTLPEAVQPSQFRQWVDMFEGEHEGIMNAYRTIYLGAGADAKVIGANMDQISFKEVQGKGETRICSAFRVEPIIIGSSEGLEAATYSNYGQALRAFADLTARPWWRNAAGSLAPLIKVPVNTRLWYDDRDIAFLREDGKDVADIQVKQATAAKMYVDAGYEPDSVTKALDANDISILAHSGLVSVQLLPPGSSAESKTPAPGATQPTPPATKPATKPATTPVAKSLDVNALLIRAESDYVPYRDSTDPKRELTWVIYDGWKAECPRCQRYAELARERFMECGCCGSMWHAEKVDRVRGSVQIEEYVARGSEFKYPPAPLMRGAATTTLANGHGHLPALLPPGPPHLHD